MRKGKFYLDFMDGYSFDGYTKDEHWNGFACPYFSFEQALKLVEAWRANGWHATYDPATEQFSFDVAEGVNKDDANCFPVIELEGMKLYPIGTRSWIWDEADH